MKFVARKTAGAGVRLAESPRRNTLFRLLTLGLVVVPCLVGAQELYKYRGENGEWIYTDRKPPEGAVSEVRELPKGYGDPTVTVTHSVADGRIQFTAHNEWYAPVQVVIELERLHNVQAPLEEPLEWVVPARSSLDILSLDPILGGAAPDIEFRYAWLHGDPAARHQPSIAYRAPFAIANEFRVTQAFPVSVTHTTPDSAYAVDIAMPIGTDIYAARDGTVFDVSSTNYRGGLDTSRDGAQANLVRILHDDGSIAVYAHLNWNTIRVRPGDRVKRGEYIADSGNTGFTTGPHLHFAVMLNRGRRLESVPVVFEGRNSSQIRPVAGTALGAY